MIWLGDCLSFIPALKIDNHLFFLESVELNI